METQRGRPGRSNCGAGLHNGFTATVQYTFSKAIDDAALGGRGTGTAVIAQNWLDLSAERALSTFDQRHVLSVQGQYTTGMGLGGGTLVNGWKGALFKEWTVTTQITASSGLPLTPVFPVPVLGTGVTGPRAAGLYGRAGLCGSLRPISESRGLRGSGLRRVGKCRERFNYGTFAVRLERVARTHFPDERSNESGSARGLVQRAQSRYLSVLEYHSRQRAVWAAQSGQCHAQSANHTQVEVLK